MVTVRIGAIAHLAFSGTNVSDRFGARDLDTSLARRAGRSRGGPTPAAGPRAVVRRAGRPPAGPGSITPASASFVSPLGFWDVGGRITAELGDAQARRCRAAVAFQQTAALGQCPGDAQSLPGILPPRP